jgi:5-methylcytosine-specific restriction enzyme subunit McrC
VNQVVQLVEHTPLQVDLDWDTAQRLKRVPGAQISVEMGESQGSWLVRPDSKVGVVIVDGVSFVIAPKMGTLNAIAMLDGNSQLVKWGNDSFSYDSSLDFLEAVVRVFLESLSRALAYGIRRDYVEKSEYLMGVRGRIDIKSLSSKPHMVGRIPCSFDEYTQDIPLMQILLMACRRLMQIPNLKAESRQKLIELESRFEGVSESQTVLSWYETWTPNRLERPYQRCVSFAALILRSVSLSLAPGGLQSPTFLIDMNVLVEEFVSRRLERKLENRLNVELQRELNLDTEGRVKIKPDIFFRQGKKPVLVADVKYKNVSSFNRAQNQDIYQVATYARALGVHRGLIISCTADEQKLDTLKFQEGDLEVELWPLDLSVSVQKMDEQIDALADQIVNWANGEVVSVLSPTDPESGKQEQPFP